MVAEVSSLPSSAGRLIAAKEATPGVLPGLPVFYELKPNSYANSFGPNFELVSPRIVSQRRRLLGDIVGTTVGAGFEIDFRPTWLDQLLPSIFHSTFDRQPTKGTVFDTGLAVTGTGYDIGTPADAAGWEGSHLLFAEGFATSANNGLKQVTGTSSDEVTVSGLTAEASPPDDAVIRAVGIQFGSGELDVVKSGSAYPILNIAQGSLDWTDFNLKAGSRIYIGGSGASNRFATAANNGFARVLSVTATDLTLDRAPGGADKTTDMSSETGSGLSIQIFLADQIKDAGSETDANFEKVSNFLERQLGIPNPTGSSGVIQTEDIDGAFINTTTIAVNKKQKSVITIDAIAIGSDEHTGESGDERTTDGETILQIADSGFMNNSSHVVRSLLSTYPDSTLGDAAPDPLVGFVDNFQIEFQNNAGILEAVGELSGFDVNVAGFLCDISIQSYFAEVAGRKSIRANDRLQFEMAWQRPVGTRNVAVMLDAPACALGGGAVQMDVGGTMQQPFTLESSESTEHDLTASMNVFWYIP